MLPDGRGAAFASDPADAREYGRKTRWLMLADIGAGALLLVAMLATGASSALRDLALRISPKNYFLALAVYVFALSLLAKAAGMAFEYRGFALEHRYNLSNQSLSSWLTDSAKSWAVGVLLGILAAEIIYKLIRSQPGAWWLWAWLIFMGMFIVMAQLAPVLLFPLFYKFIPLEDEALKQRLTRLSEKAGTRVRGVYEWKLSEKSKKANAALTGLGNTRRIILADTLLRDYSHDEIEAVLAHELGHHVRGHIFQSIAVQSGITLVGFWLAARLLEYSVHSARLFRDLHDFANLPLLLLLMAAMSLLLMPAVNAFSRRNERQADDYCWSAIPDTAPFVSAMEKLSAQNLSEKAPSPLVEWFFHSHPAIGKRIAAAKNFRRTG